MEYFDDKISSILDSYQNSRFCVFKTGAWTMLLSDLLPIRNSINFLHPRHPHTLSHPITDKFPFNISFENDSNVCPSQSWDPFRPEMRPQAAMKVLPIILIFSILVNCCSYMSCKNKSFSRDRADN